MPGFASSGFVLVDFANVADLPKGREARYKDVEDALTEIVRKAVAAAKTLAQAPSSLRFRLYGGWDENDRATFLGDLVAASIRKNSFGRRSMSVQLELASSLLEWPSWRLQNTVRLSPGLPWFRTRTNHPSCPRSSGDSCSLSLVERWQRGHCPDSSCSLEPDQVFSKRRQKLVDSAITCDAIYLARREPESWLIIATDDDDLIPGLVSASTMCRRVAQLARRSHGDYYDKFLSRAGVSLLSW
jgi:hypothetical protein